VACYLGTVTPLSLPFLCYVSKRLKTTLLFSGNERVHIMWFCFNEECCIMESNCLIESSFSASRP
jgi:hypothetical protein